jgi:hypothetical protein
MLALHLRANRKEVVVGWYWYASCSGDQEIADTSSLIHEFYASEVEESDPIHITVDTHLLDDSLKIRAYLHRFLLLAMFSKCSQHQSIGRDIWWQCCPSSFQGMPF